VFADLVGRRMIGAKARAANQDILRCWLFSPVSIRQAAAKRADNSVTIGMNARPLGSRSDVARPTIVDPIRAAHATP
jgi:hypothetical protein